MLQGGTLNNRKLPDNGVVTSPWLVQYIIRLRSPFREPNTLHSKLCCSNSGFSKEKYSSVQQVYAPTDALRKWAETHFAKCKATLHNLAPHMNYNNLTGIVQLSTTNGHDMYA